MFLEILQNSQENICARVSFLIKLQAEDCNFIENEALAQVFSFEFCKTSKNTFFTEHLFVTAFNQSKRRISNIKKREKDKKYCI